LRERGRLNHHNSINTTNARAFSREGGSMGPTAGTTFGFGTPYMTSPYQQQSPWQQQNPLQQIPWQQLSQIQGQSPYGPQLLQAVPQLLHQLQNLQQQQLIQLQQLLQYVPTQLQQIQQLLQVIVQQVSQSSQGFQSFGAGAPSFGLGPFQQPFGPGAGHVM
jgi:hypothetical protein